MGDLTGFYEPHRVMFSLKKNNVGTFSIKNSSDVKASQQMPQEQKPQIRPDMLRMGLLNVWKVAPQTRPQWDNSSELHHSMQVPQAIFVAFQQRCL